MAERKQVPDLTIREKGEDTATAAPTGEDGASRKRPLSDGTPSPTRKQADEKKQKPKETEAGKAHERSWEVDTTPPAAGYLAYCFHEIQFNGERSSDGYNLCGCRQLRSDQADEMDTTDSYECSGRYRLDPCLRDWLIDESFVDTGIKSMTVEYTEHVTCGMLDCQMPYGVLKGLLKKEALAIADEKEREKALAKVEAMRPNDLFQPCARCLTAACIFEWKRVPYHGTVHLKFGRRLHRAGWIDPKHVKIFINGIPLPPLVESKIGREDENGQQRPGTNSLYNFDESEGTLWGLYAAAKQKLLKVLTEGDIGDSPGNSSNKSWDSFEDPSAFGDLMG